MIARGGGSAAGADRLLVDTSVWIDHLRGRRGDLAGPLQEGLVLTHPHVIGELACGNLARRDEVLRLLAALPQAPEATHAEALALVAGERLSGRGLGWVDVHLLAGARLAAARLWTRDRALAAAAARLGLGYPA
ncbi:MAG: PIN domain-containing protein [bacterium]|nr:PIN domain-containing protein [bacterium]